MDRSSGITQSVRGRVACPSLPREMSEVAPTRKRTAPAVHDLRAVNPLSLSGNSLCQTLS